MFRFRTALVKPYLEYWSPVLVSSVPERHGHIGVSPAKDHEDNRGTAASVLPWELELLCLQKRRLRADIINGYKYLIVGSGVEWSEEAEPDSSVTIERTRGNGHKVKYRRSHPNMRKKFTCECSSTVKVELRACVACMSPSLEVLATQLDVTLSNLL